MPYNPSAPGVQCAWAVIGMHIPGGLVLVGQKLRKAGIVTAAMLLLSSCGLFQNGGSMMDFGFWETSPFMQGDSAELGIAEMTKGNYLGAEKHFRNALKNNPRDVHALLGAAILYHNTGQLVRAREMYEAVLALRPPESEQFINLSDVSTHPIAQIASVNLSLLESGAVLGGMFEGAAGLGNQPSAQPMYGVPTMAQPVTQPMAKQQGAAMTQPLTGQMSAFPSSSALSLGGMAPSVTELAPEIVGFTGGDVNTISRFATIRALRDQGLITPDEFAARRQANAGALLPLSSPPPAAGLDRPVPGTEQVTARLQAIGRALELRAISVSQHAAERNMILDALMPAAPVVVANPGMPPQGLMEAADMVRRLEMLRDAGFISSDEYARERAGIEAALMPAQPMAPVQQSSASMSMAPGEPVQITGAPAVSGPQPSIHLASYRSTKQAERGWAQLRRAHPDLLGDLNFTVMEINLGSKGIFFRLIAGPVSSNQGAKDICDKLKSRRQFCDPTFAEFG